MVPDCAIFSDGRLTIYRRFINDRVVAVLSVLVQTLPVAGVAGNNGGDGRIGFVLTGGISTEKSW
jgi:hypothetical protein